VLKPVGSKIFSLPNGGTADISVDLNAMFTTAVTNTSSLSPWVSAIPDDANGNHPGTDPCESHLEIRGDVTTLQLDIAQVGLTIGWNPAGSYNVPITNITGKAHAKIGVIAMDFSVWQCQAGSCTAVAASTSDHVTAGVSVAVDIDFSSVTAGPSLIFNTPLGSALRRIMENGIQQMANSIRINELDWTARVVESNPQLGLVTFDVGMQSRIAPNQGFEVYAPNANTWGACRVYQLVGYIHSTTVGAVSSYAIVDQLFGARTIQVGDVVMVRRVAN
jgi:hypothetical protein